MIMLSKEEFKEVIEKKAIANSFEALMKTITDMHENGDLSLVAVLQVISGIYGKAVDDFNEYITPVMDQHPEGIGIDDIVIIQEKK